MASFVPQFERPNQSGYISGIPAAELERFFSIPSDDQLTGTIPPCDLRYPDHSYKIVRLANQEDLRWTIVQGNSRIALELFPFDNTIKFNIYPCGNPNFQNSYMLAAYLIKLMEQKLSIQIEHIETIWDLASSNNMQYWEHREQLINLFRYQYQECGKLEYLPACISWLWGCTVKSCGQIYTLEMIRPQQIHLISLFARFLTFSGSKVAFANGFYHITEHSPDIDGRMETVFSRNQS